MSRDPKRGTVPTKLVWLSVSSLALVAVGSYLAMNQLLQLDALLERLITPASSVSAQLWWTFNIHFASATQLTCAAAILYQSRRVLRRNSDQRTSSNRYFSADIAYYFALWALAQPQGQAQVGHNPALEVINLYLGYQLLLMAAALNAFGARAQAWLRGLIPPIAMVAIACVIVLGPGTLEHFGLMEWGAQTRLLRRWCPTTFVAVCGTVYFAAIVYAYFMERASAFVVAATFLYACGLWFRLEMTLDPALWASYIGLIYYIAMLGKFAGWQALCLAQPTYSGRTGGRSKLGWRRRWLERSGRGSAATRHIDADTTPPN